MKKKRSKAQRDADARRTGRPSMGRDARRIPVIVKASANERPAWAKRAKAEGLSLASWLAKPRRDELEGSK